MKTGHVTMKAWDAVKDKLDEMKRNIEKKKYMRQAFHSPMNFS